MEVYEKALKVLLKHEGGYVNNTNDSGGETYKGVSRKWFPKFKGWEIIDTYEDKTKLGDSVELQEAISDFYYSYFWYKLKLDDVKDPFVASMIFGYSVSAGKKQIVRKVQRIVSTNPDGLIGNLTLTAINSMDPKAFVHHFLLEMFEFYTQVAKKGNNRLFLMGWMNRVSATYYDSELYFKDI